MCARVSSKKENAFAVFHWARGFCAKKKKKIIYILKRREKPQTFLVIMWI